MNVGVWCLSIHKLGIQLRNHLTCLTAKTLITACLPLLEHALMPVCILLCTMSHVLLLSVSRFNTPQHFSSCICSYIVENLLNEHLPERLI